ncbi:GGDEF domain-containing protein [Rhizobiaceae bacterium BDR2-2]|uniref:Diguanylate cyclase DosC n=1 Tax=Ectorhizobium quercum TaxID=2965071 RepID=A0AAE3SXF4_9HYPH|nr:GGDEF domain-containing protein [Ectorhizobium quercum]MCX8998994.1 GGDEF domain-containing protein [Ectorhizobium quercum]
MEQQWKQLLGGVSPDVAALLATLAEQHATEFSRKFYQTLLADPRASVFVTHEAVDTRLHASFQRWITSLLTRLSIEDVPALIADQQQIGIIHARLNIPIELVLRASRRMKEVVLEAILSHPGRYKARLEAAILAMGLTDVAMEIMSAQYADSHDSVTRTDEAYRNYAATMNMSLERECQRTALSDWSNRLLQDVMIGGSDIPLSRIGHSPFGLWIRHKAPAIFIGPRELETIRASMDTIDERHLLELEAAIAREDMPAVRRLTRLAIGEVEQVRHLLDTLFDHLVRMESGSDALTHLLNRRFLPTILGREIGLARSKGIVFSLLLLDIDHFKTINDQYGHETGDRTLQQIAQTLSRLTGSGDFLFRYGGEEFLIVCAECDAARAHIVAERIRREIENRPIELPDQTRIRVTLSVGLSTYDGHPDYHRLIQHADQALYHAKATGRNRTVDYATLPQASAQA